MKFTLPLSLVLLALGAVDARPGGWGKRDDKSAEIVAKRQTTREEINNRAHVKDTVKRVHNVIDKQVDLNRKAGNYKRTPARLAARQDFTQFRKREDIEEMAARAAAKEAARKRAVPPAPSVPKEKRTVVESTPELVKKDDQPELVKKDHESPPMAMMNMRPRGQYPRCDKSGAKTGYAHYPGWKLSGDDLSGGIPVTPESACVLACNKYGGACSGIYFDANLKRCYLKGVHTTAWEFEAVTTGQSTDLVGGCALWANVVPPEMDAVCCRN